MSNNDIEVLKDELAYRKAQFADEGGNVRSAGFRRVMDREAATAQEETDKEFGTDTQTNTIVTTLLRRLLGWLVIVFTAVFLLGGTLAAVILFPVAEYEAVRTGLKSFETSSALASLQAVTVVVGYIVLLFLRNLLRDNLPEDNNPRLTLRRTFGNVGYFLGLSNKSHDMSRAQELYIGTLAGIAILQLVVMFLGFQGRVAANMLAAGDVSYYAFVWELFTGASPIEFFGYVGNLVLTFALLTVTDNIVLFIYNVFINTAGDLRLTSKVERGVRNRFLTRRTYERQLAEVNNLLIMKRAKQAQTQNEPTSS